MGLSDILRKFSSPRNSAAFTAINLLLGVGPLIVPEPFFRTGFVFSIVWTTIVILFSYCSALFIGESIILINKHKDESVLSEGNQSSLVTSENEPVDGDRDEPKTIRTFDHADMIGYLYG